jgi:hypothetical protein
VIRALISNAISKNLIVFAGLLLAQLTLAAGTATAQDINTIVANMVRAQRLNRAQHTAYEVVRNYQLYKADHTQPDSHVTAAVDFLPPGEKSFKITESSGGMAEHVVRKSLEREVQLTQDPSQTEYSPANYDFTLVGSDVIDGNRCYVLALKPKQDSKDLLNGNAWVDAKTFLIRKVEGSPSKSLSFWLKDVHVSFSYNNVNGMWLRTASRASAHVRFSGEMNLVSRDVNFRSLQGEDVASMTANSAMRPTRYAPQARARRSGVANNYR